MSGGARWTVLVAVVAYLAITREPARADEPAPPRPWHAAVGVGGYAAITGPVSTGGVGEAELYPGGALGRLGLRLEARTVERDGSDVKSALYTAGVLYEAAAARPRLSLALHAEAGAIAPGGLVALGGGVETTLWVIGPLAVALDSTATVVIDGVDTDLVLAGATTVRLAR